MKAADSLAALTSDLRVGTVAPNQALEWGTVMMSAFGFTSAGKAELVAARVGLPNFRQYAVWEGQRMVAVAALYFNGECANLMSAGTLPEARGRGAQTALLAARIRDAAAAGCRWVVAETGAEAPGEPNTSLRNMMRAGFELLYERVTWSWHA
ncbi:Acetyltransferase (GNAT) domain-containing protein [Actinacidiphila guanduensis]|uniref:Acetyltransferase (GNAT) domain-containing protein n=1 Tax=Actinacidiphila guanduensis TaxID=310781 RepID=A0A1H0S180_9ACTN|nr:Acetyltransferase (GNAT) domain-containing protein [Actinacidiphila guanduensis]